MKLCTYITILMQVQTKHTRTHTFCIGRMKKRTEEALTKKKKVLSRIKLRAVY